jgi:vacuolar protein sorting-associated protein 13A/C
MHTPEFSNIRLATKPVVGMFDFASNVSEGVRNTTTLFDRDPLDRFRRPRFIAKDGVVRPYNTFEGTLFIFSAKYPADGQFALRQASDGKYFRENYVFHLVTLYMIALTAGPSR